MSLQTKWEEYRTKLGETDGLSAYEEDLAQRAFYAGAEAGLETDPINYWKIKAEIDRLKGQK